MYLGIADQAYHRSPGTVVKEGIGRRGKRACAHSFPSPGERDPNNQQGKGGKTLKRQDWTREDDALLQQLYPDLSDSDVAQHMQRTLWSIQARARRLHLTKNAEYRSALNQAHGQRLRERNLTYHVNHHYFSRITTREQAYWLGWLWSDGYVRQRGGSGEIELELHRDDVNILEQFKAAVESDYPIRFRRDSARLCIISRQMFQDLGEYGIIPQKSKLATRPNIDAFFVADFMRGVFDGDGYISKNRQPQVVIIGTEAFCSWLQSVAQRAIGARGTVALKKNATFWWILSGRENLSAFAQWIYAPLRNGERVICLARKYQRFIEAGLL